jgi:multiple sugar transport system permease protein/alpha-1,4-digalacturonate transport system permease protein
MAVTATGARPAPGTRTAAAERRRRRRLLGAGARFATAAVLALLMAFPIYWMLATAVSSPSDLRSGDYGLLPSTVRPANFTDTLSAYPWGTWFLNSWVIAVLGVALTVWINLVCGYAFAKLRFPGRKVLFVLIVSTLMVPIQVLMVPQFQIIADLGWLNSIWGVVIPRAAEAFGIFFARQYFASIPDAVIEAARIDGASELTILRRVVLPVSKPLIAVLVIFTFMWRWNEFAWPLIVLKDTQSYTAPIGLLFLQGQNTIDYSALMAMALLSVLPIILVFVFFQRYFVEGVVRSGLK